MPCKLYNWLKTIVGDKFRLVEKLVPTSLDEAEDITNSEALDKVFKRMNEAVKVLGLRHEQYK